MSRRPGLPLHLQHPYYSVPNFIPMSMRTEHTEGIQLAIQALPGNHHAHQDNLGYAQYRDFQGYQGGRHYPGSQEYQGYDGYEFHPPIPITVNNNSPNNQPPGMAEWGYGAFLGQDFNANGWPLQFIQPPPIDPRMSTIGYLMNEISTADPMDAYQRLNDRQDALPPARADANKPRLGLPMIRGAQSGAPSARIENKPTKHRINPEAPPFVPSMAAGNAQAYVQPDSANVRHDRWHRNGQVNVARPPTDLDEYAKKLERWIGMEDDDEFMYFDEEPAAMKGANAQSAC